MASRTARTARALPGRATVQVLAEDADLAAAIPAMHRETAIQNCHVPLMLGRPGLWHPPAEAPNSYVGLLVLDGICQRAFRIGERRAIGLFGPGDLLKPWKPAPMWGQASAAEWRLLTPTRFAVLDRSFTQQMGAFPELAIELIEREIQRNRELVFNMAIASHTRVDTRLHLMLWQMAAKWGRMRSDGVLLPLQLTHVVLSELVASRRPTITTALAELNQRGLVQRVDEGWLLLGDPPEDLLG